jgi:hypothetical protein
MSAMGRSGCDELCVGQLAVLSHSVDLMFTNLVAPRGRIRHALFASQQISSTMTDMGQKQT